MTTTAENIRRALGAAWVLGVPVAYGFFGTWFAETGMRPDAAWFFAAPIVAAVWPASMLVWLGSWLA